MSLTRKVKGEDAVRVAADAYAISPALIDSSVILMTFIQKSVLALHLCFDFFFLPPWQQTFTRTMTGSSPVAFGMFGGASALVFLNY